MWIDATNEPAFAELFDLKAENLPKLVVLNPGKRKRYLIHDKLLTDEDISKTLDKI